MRKYIRTELTFFIQWHREKPKGCLFSELLEDECPFLLSQGKGEDKKWQGRKKFVVEITPYYYEHGVFMEDHDGVRMKYRIQKLIYRDQVQIYIKGQ